MKSVTAGGPAGEKITVMIGGKIFECSRRTAAHLLYTIDRLKKVNPNARLYVIQGCYNTTVELSAGTHDKDACLDVRIDGMEWWAAQKFLRQCGWGAYFRHTGSWAAVSKFHIHMFSLPPLTGWVAPVGIYVPGQLVDYYAHTFGLANQHNVDADKSWFPGDPAHANAEHPIAAVGNPTLWRAAIDKTIFDYPAWVKKQEENMGYRDWDKEDKDAFLSDFWGFVPKGADAPVSQLIKQSANSPGLIRQLANALGKKLS